MPCKADALSMGIRRLNLVCPVDTRHALRAIRTIELLKRPGIQKRVLPKPSYPCTSRHASQKPRTSPTVGDYFCCRTYLLPSVLLGVSRPLAGAGRPVRPAGLPSQALATVLDLHNAQGKVGTIFAANISPTPDKAKRKVRERRTGRARGIHWSLDSFAGPRDTEAFYGRGSPPFFLDLLTLGAPYPTRKITFAKTHGASRYILPMTQAHKSVLFRNKIGLPTILG